MENQNLPFEITPQIRRYLKEIVDFNNEFFAQDLGEIYTLESYLGDEKPTFRKEENHNNFWEYLQEKRIIKMVGEPVAKTVYYSDQSFGVIVPFQYKFRILDIKPIEELLEKIKLDETIKSENSRPSNVVFNQQNYVLRYKNLVHSFHKGIAGEPLPPKLQLFIMLWDKRKYIKNGKVQMEGNFYPPATLAVQLGITDSNRTYGLNKEIGEKLYNRVKDLKRPLIQKGFPIDIIKKNGYLLTITESRNKKVQE